MFTHTHTFPPFSDIREVFDTRIKILEWICSWHHLISLNTEVSPSPAASLVVVMQIGERGESESFKGHHHHHFDASKKALSPSL